MSSQLEEDHVAPLIYQVSTMCVYACVRMCMRVCVWTVHSLFSEELVKKLLPLGYTRATIMRELAKGGGGDSKLSSLLLQAQQQREYSVEDKEEQKSVMVKNIEVRSMTQDVIVLHYALKFWIAEVIMAR